MKKIYFLTFIALIITMIVGVAFGATPISIYDLSIEDMVSYFNDDLEDSTSYIIIFRMRLPRVILAFLVGAVLAGCGVAFQSLLKNPLAEPYTLGVSSGAGLGAAIGIFLLTTVSSMPFKVPYLISLLAFITGLITVFIVLTIAQSQGQLKTINLILAGVVISSTFSALISFIMLFANENMRQIYFWLMGNLSMATWERIYIALIPIIIGMLIIAFNLKRLNIMQLGDETAQSLGVEVNKIKKIVMLGATLATAAAVSVSGLIGFVGLIIPHTLRIILGSSVIKIFPLSMIWGGIFLILADLLARTVLSPMEIPVGVITALFGGPFFLYLLKSKSKGDSV
ncbi:iron ABC transporter permease [Proteinivorax hydrogeniformans]|uniref:Iron ABC transporter permease n=1 Tax=Proteinivorax hydrogeniformans TaxID=1826727 RepID=A0AAU8HWT5_9FIRM